MDQLDGLMDDLIRLRKPLPSDTDELFTLASQSKLGQFTYIPEPYLHEHAEAWIEKQTNNPTSLFIILKETNEIMGVISLLSYDIKRRNTELAYWLGTTYRSKGFMKRTINIILNYLNEQTQIMKVYARVFEENIASQSLLQSVGFTIEGKLVKNEFHKGEMKTVICMGICFNKAI